MGTLLVAGTFMDNITSVTQEIGADSMVCATLFFMFVGLSALTAMNMLIGILCEVVGSVADCEKESMLIQYVTNRFETIWKDLDTDGSGTLSKDEFLMILSDKEAWAALEEVNVDPMSLVKLVDLIFEGDDADDKNQLTLPEFMEVILSFRSSNTATVKDINNLRKCLDSQMHKQQERQMAEIKQMMINQDKPFPPGPMQVV